MANTEGMSDEFIQSLTMTTDGATTAPAAAATTTRSGGGGTKNPMTTTMTAEERRRRRFQERMDMPLGETPAAKVAVRSARNANAKKNAASETPSNAGAGRVRFAEEEVEEEERSSTIVGSSPDGAATATTLSQSQSQSQSNPMSMFANGNPMIGEIKEHSQKPVVKKKKKIITGNNGSNNITTRGGGATAEGVEHQSFSRFAQQKQQKQGQTRATTIASSGSTGFPSLNVPMGTFVRKKKKSVNKKASTKPTTTSSTTITEKANAASTIAPPVTTSISSISINDGTASSDNNIQDASQKDADRMISNFSVDEIRQYQQEIQSSMSPDMIEFLKKRRRTKDSSSSASSKTTPDSNISAAKSPERNDGRKETNELKDENNISTSTKTEDSVNTDKQKEREEKERIANIISSVRTYEDLDSVYETEMKQPHPLAHEEEQEDINKILGDNSVDKDDDGDNDDDEEKFLIACDLLRSTARRQSLWAARIVSLRLSKMVQSQQQRQQRSSKQGGKTGTVGDEATQSSPLSSPSSLPILLSVSLRCLLDKPTSAAYLLHAYALQSLYSLSLVYSTPKDGGLSTMSDEQTYQIFFMDDAVPARSMQDMYAPVNVQPLNVDNGSAGDSSSFSSAAGAAAYSTSSSSTSAMTDAQAFKKDPMWTLLSKMKIVPRLSFLVQQFDIPVEAWIAICGLLEMVGRRSPGAASAIVQHEHLVPNIHKRMLQELHNRTPNKKQINVTLASIRMFCALARQSKAVAEQLPLEDLLPPLLALEASNSDEYHAQQLALVLWRTSLRYGLGLPALASMLTFSTRSFALPYSNQYSLSSDFISGFTEVIECSRVIASKTPDMISSATKQHKIDEKVLPVAETAAKYLSTVIAHLLPTTSTPVSQVEDGISSSDWAARYRWHGARLSFLSSWIHLTCPVEEAIDSLIALPPSLSIENQISILEALHSWSNLGGDVEKLWKMVLTASIIPTCLSSEDGETKTEASRAAGCAFLKGFFSTVSAFLLFESPDDRIRELKQSLDQKLRTLILDVAKTTFSVGDREALRDCTSKASLRLAKDGWNVQAHYAVAKHLLHATSRGVISLSSDLTVARSIVFSLLCKLQKGDEAVAAVLFSADALYQTNGNPLADFNETITSSPVSSMFLGELCANGNERTQLDHSFKLHHGFGITSDGLGPFGLESLLSSADRAPTLPSNESEGNSDLEGSVLPLDRLWLWQTLSGSIRVNSGNVVKGTKEAKEVVLSALNLLIELEEGEEIAGITGYSSSIPVGSKLYYIMNVCLQPEDVIRDEGISSTTEAIVRRYVDCFGHTNDDGVIFCEECFYHSNPSNVVKDDDIAHDGGDDTEEASTVKDQNVLEKYLSQEQDLHLGENAVIFPTSQLKALEAFVEDLCTAYRDYGAQYSFFTQCIRIFLLPVFPDSIRRRVLQELEDMLNLLTVPDNDDMRYLLQKFILGGLPEADNSCRDNPMILDAIATAIERSRSLSRPLQGFTLYFAAALLARSLSIGISSTDQAIISMNKRRLQRFDSSMILLICDVAEAFLESSGTRKALVDAVDAAIKNSEAADTAQDNIGDKQTVDSNFVDGCVRRLVSREFN